LSNESLDNDLVQIGINFRAGMYPNHTWESLNIDQGSPFKNGESFRGFIKKTLKKEGKLPTVEKVESEHLVEKNKELLAQKIQLDFMKQQRRDELTYLNKNKRPLSRTEVMCDVLRDITSPLPNQAPFIFIKPAKRRKVIVALHSDGQVGEMIKLDDSGGFNEYNLEIYNQRQQKYLNTILEDSNELGITEAFIPFLGDAIEGDGNIYKSQKFYLESHFVKQIFDVSESNAWFLKGLQAGGLKTINTMAVVGNHGRSGQDNHAQANFDTIAYDRTQLLLRGENINFQYSNTFMEVINVLGYYFLIIHGDGMNKQTLESSFYKYSYMYASKGIQLYGLLCGHFHAPMTLDVMSTAGSIIVNGNIVGSNHLSVQKLQSDNKPSQTYVIIEEGKGITYSRKVVLS